MCGVVPVCCRIVPVSLAVVYRSEYYQVPFIIRGTTTRLNTTAAVYSSVCVLLIKPFFLPVDIQYHTIIPSDIRQKNRSSLGILSRFHIDLSNSNLTFCSPFLDGSPVSRRTTQTRSSLSPKRECSTKRIDTDDIHLFSVAQQYLVFDIDFIVISVTLYQ